jgi:hypothetical protein
MFMFRSMVFESLLHFLMFFFAVFENLRHAVTTLPGEMTNESHDAPHFVILEHALPAGHAMWCHNDFGDARREEGMNQSRFR